LDNAAIYAKKNSMVKTELKKPPKGPQHWLSWLIVGMLWLLGRLPYRLGLLLVRPLGPLMLRLMGSRRKVAQRNIERCYPEMGEAEREQLLRGAFRSLARMLVETAWCWSASLERLATRTRVEGIEHLQDAEELGRGVLVLTFHTTCLEMGGFILCNNTRTSGIYRPGKNPVLEWYQNRGRMRLTEHLIKKDNPRKAIRILRQGGVVWYAPDQDFGADQTEFAPFFGIQTSTLLATRRFPSLTGCAVVPMFPRYEEDSGTYVMTIFPALEDFPSDDVLADLTRVNAIMEAQARKVPEQYWWIHRRFKTRPPGEPPFYD
jgi:KDO2-lipid IV(A) lauroyltransferase